MPVEFWGWRDENENELLCHMMMFSFWVMQSSIRRHKHGPSFKGASFFVMLFRSVFTIIFELKSWVPYGLENVLHMDTPTILTQREPLVNQAPSLSWSLITSAPLRSITFFANVIEILTAFWGIQKARLETISHCPLWVRLFAKAYL
jgi:hypothetical protein